MNLRRVHKIEFKEQIIMGYGGLRGAVGFSLAVVLDDKVEFIQCWLVVYNNFLVTKLLYNSLCLYVPISI